MKYIVEVNAKYLVSVEADSVLQAEHKVLDYDGIWGALAFDRDMMKTDTFMGAVQGCEMIGMKELEAMSKDYADAYVEKAKAQDAHKAADDEVKRLEALLSLAKENRSVTLQNVYTANKAVADADGCEDGDLLPRLPVQFRRGMGLPRIGQQVIDGDAEELGKFLDGIGFWGGTSFPIYRGGRGKTNGNCRGRRRRLLLCADAFQVIVKHFYLHLY